MFRIDRVFMFAKLSISILQVDYRDSFISNGVPPALDTH
jgi:hypothetical protein